MYDAAQDISGKEGEFYDCASHNAGFLADKHSIFKHRTITGQESNPSLFKQEVPRQGQS